MSTAELKIDLINQITEITDEVYLREILQLLSFQSDKSTYITSDDVKNSVMEARSEIKKGELTSNEEVHK